MEYPARAFKHRAFVAMVMAFSGLALPVTGIANHFYGFAPPSLERHAWMSAHNALGLLFVVFSIWHAVLNRKALWSHVRNAAACVPGVSREAMVAGSLVAVVLALFVGHALHAGH
ncbi:MAG: DUF4405 domain-containing protein [Vicinamibacterales bacterium]